MGGGGHRWGKQIYTSSKFHNSAEWMCRSMLELSFLARHLHLATLASSSPRTLSLAHMVPLLPFLTFPLALFHITWILSLFGRTARLQQYRVFTFPWCPVREEFRFVCVCDPLSVWGVAMQPKWMPWIRNNGLSSPLAESSSNRNNITEN